MYREKANKEDEFAGYKARAWRGPRKSAKVAMMTDLAMRATRESDPLRKINLLYEIVLLANNESALPLDVANTASVVGACFGRACKVELEPNLTIVEIPWSFSSNKENYLRYIDPWHRVSRLYYFALGTHLANEYPKRPVDDHGAYEPYCSAEEFQRWKTAVEQAICERIRKLEGWLSFFTVTCALAQESYLALLGEFEGWALSRLLPVMSLIALELDS